MGYPGLGDYSTRDRFMARTWQVEPRQAQQIADLADALALTHSSLIRLLIDYSLDAVLNGELEIDREPVLFKAVALRR